MSASLEDHLCLPRGTCTPTQAARVQQSSTLHFLGEVAAPHRCRWVVKQPHVGPWRGGTTDPLTAEHQYAALVELTARLRGSPGSARVAAPVALMPGLGAFAMAHVAGSTLADLLGARSVQRPAALLDAVGAAAELLAVVHRSAALPPRAVDLSAAAATTLALVQDRLVPAGLLAPPAVVRTLAAVPATTVVAPRVRLHGDFTPSNFLLPDGGEVVGVDIDLASTGTPEEDLARFASCTSTAGPYLGDTAPQRSGRHHRPLEAHLLERYGAPVCAPLLELHHLEHLAVRWLRLHQLTRLHGRAQLLPLRLQAVAARIPALMLESAHRLHVAM